MSTDNLTIWKNRLARLLLEKAYREGSFTLSSGGTSDYYIEGKMVTLDPEGIHLIGNIILEMLEGAEFDAVGGPTIGADPIAAVVSHASWLKNPEKPIPAFIVRKEQKTHGAQRAIEGPLPPRARVVVVEDVVTTGKSVLQAVRALEQHGCAVVRIIAIVDRESGLLPELENYRFTPIFTISEIKALAGRTSEKSRQ